MKTIRVYGLNTLSPALFRRLKEAQMDAARVWNRCMELHKEARLTHARWPDATDLHQATRGQFALNAQAVQQIFRAFLGTIETTRRLRQEHPEMRMKYPWRTKRFYPVKWPAQAVHKAKGRVILPMGKGHPSLVLPLDLPENAGACTLVWNRGFELHVCVEAQEAEQAPGTVQATVDLGEIHLAALTTTTGAALIVTGRGIRSLKRQRSKQLGQLAKKQSRCQKHSRRWKKLQRAKNKVCRGAARARPAPQGHQASDRFLHQEPSRDALHRQSARRAHPGLRPSPQWPYGAVGIRPRH
jgi:putative transposase